MPTIKQIEANRLNSKKSTGPRSLEGKAVTRMNALKSGIDAASQVIRGEDPQAFETLAAEYHHRFQAATPEQRSLVDALIYSEWLLRRLRKTEAQIWGYHWNRYEESGHLNPDLPLGNIYCSNVQTFSRIQRRIDSTERNYHRSLKELERLRAQPAEPDPALDPAPQPTVSGTVCPPIGFVPQPPPPVVSAAGHLRRDSNLCHKQFGFVPQLPAPAFCSTGIPACVVFAAHQQ